MVKLIFADLDGTLINTRSGSTFPKGVWDMELRLMVLDKIKEVNPKYLYIVSNQGGIEKGFVDRDRFLSKMDYIACCIEEYCGCVVRYSYCTSNDKDDNMRKPNPGMLYELLEWNGSEIHESEMLMIGDASGLEGQFSDSDKKCAENFGIKYMDVNDFVRWQL